MDHWTRPIRETNTSSMSSIISLDTPGPRPLGHAGKRRQFEYWRQSEKVHPPLVVYSDRGTHFIGKPSKAFWKKMGIMHVSAPSASPRSTSLIENWNKALEERIWRIIANPENRGKDCILG